MTFIHNDLPIEIPELKTKNINRKRFYQAPNGQLYPSITTVLNKKKMQGINEWRKKVGEDVANYIARTAANRGTKVHHMCEDFLNNNFDDEVHKKNFLPYVLFGQMKPILMQKVNNILVQECGLYSDKYKVAGRVDCIAKYNGVPSIIDFKTSRKFKKKQWCHNYFMQESAYAIMWEERTQMPITQLVTLIAVDDRDPIVYIEHRDNWVTPLKSVIAQWNEENTSVKF